MIKFGGNIALGILVLLTACQNQTTCKYKPEPIFAKDLPHIVQYNFEKEGSQSLESIMLDRGVLLEIGQEVCGDTKQEYRFTVKGDFAAQPDLFWINEAAGEFNFLSTLSPKQAPLKDWAEIIKLRREDIKIGQDHEVQPGVFIRIDKVVSPEEATLVVLFSQKN
jgi:hypothetical protein